MSRAGLGVSLVVGLSGSSFALTPEKDEPATEPPASERWDGVIPPRADCDGVAPPAPARPGVASASRLGVAAMPKRRSANPHSSAWRS